MKIIQIFILLILSAFIPVKGQSPQKEMKTNIKGEINYLLFLPRNYSETGSPSPMIVFLHGMGQRGNNLERVKKFGPPAIVEKNPDFPFVLISPQCPDGKWWDCSLLKGMIDEVVRKYNVDKTRIYLTGLSMGGYGTWDLAMNYPEYFAAVAPVCGGGNIHLADRLKNTPVWAFHGKKDNAVPMQESAVVVDTLKKLGDEVKYTVLPEGDHEDAWVYAYGDSGLFDWFLEHQKK
jgi:predicted peptidase